MQMFRRVLGTTLALLLVAPASWAQQTHVIDKSTLDQAVQQRVSQDEADRETLRTFLANPTVKSVAAKAGVSIDKARAAVTALQGDELHRAATQVRDVNNDLAGGTTVVITTTTIIIILLIVIVIILLAK